MEGNRHLFLTCRAAALLLLTPLLIAESECRCSRMYTLNEPDCSTVMPCFVKLSDGNFQQLAYPRANEQLCYRTCINSDSSNTCEARLVSNHSIPIVRQYGNGNYQLSIHSQGFRWSRMYRKSSICRYAVECDEGQFLSYAIHTHILEEPASCYNTKTCVDYLTIFHRGLGGMETTCGTINNYTLHNDGSRNLLVEFQSNRKNESTGFEIMVYCVSPGSTERDTRSVDSNHTGTGTGTCTSPKATWKREGHDQEETTTDPAHKLAAAFPNHSEKILSSSMHITVDVYGHVNYTNGTIVISQPDGKLREFSGVTSFHLSNRIVNDKVFKFSAPDRYHGYGYIVLCKWQAFFLQDGINPEYRPTEEEQAIIKQLQTGLMAELTKDTWGDERSSQDLPKDPTREWLEETASLVETARHYSIACNALLRSVACTYLKVVANEDCE